MYKDFNKFLNEGYIHKWPDTFVSELDRKINIDYNYDREKYESLEDINVKVEWGLNLEIQKDGIYDFNPYGVKAVVEVRYLLKEDPNSEKDYEEEDYEEFRTYEIESDNIEFEKAVSVKQIVIDTVEVDLESEKPKLECKLVS